MAKTPDKWAILIGVNRYHESLGPLKYAVNDCRRVGEVLTQGQDGFPADHVLLVADDQAEDRRPTYANIHSWLASWLSQPKEDDTVLVYFSGHGREMGGKCYLAPGDATLQTMHVTGIPVAHVQDILARCKAKQKILVLDACHSGAGKDVAAMSGSMLDQIAAGKGIYTITSCDTDELSHEWDEKKQGVFSYYLAEALSGACPPDAQGRVTAESLYEWVYDRVRSWAAKKRCTQTPKRFAEGTGAFTLRTGVLPQPTLDVVPPAKTDTIGQAPAHVTWDSQGVVFEDVVATTSVRYRPAGVKRERVTLGRVKVWDPQANVGIIDCGQLRRQSFFGRSDLGAGDNDEWCHAGSFVRCEVTDLPSGVRAWRVQPMVPSFRPSSVWRGWAALYSFILSLVHMDWTRHLFFDDLGRVLDTEGQRSVRLEKIRCEEGKKDTWNLRDLQDGVLGELQSRGFFVGNLPHSGDYVLHGDVRNIDEVPNEFDTRNTDIRNPTVSFTLMSSAGKPVWSGRHKFKGVKFCTIYDHRAK